MEIFDDKDDGCLLSHRRQEGAHRGEQAMAAVLGVGELDLGQGGKTLGQLGNEPGQVRSGRLEVPAQPLDRAAGDVAGEGFGQCFARDEEVLVGASEEHHGVVEMGGRRELSGERGLAHARLAPHEDHSVPAGSGFTPGCVELGELLGPSDERARAPEAVGERRGLLGAQG